MEFNFDKKEQYSSEDAYEDLEAIREILSGAKKKITRSRLEEASIDLQISICVENYVTPGF